MADDTRERIAALEANLSHMSRAVDDMGAKVDEMHALMLKAQGTKYVVWTLAAVFGVAAPKLSAFLPILGKAS
jgi:hypothetical protein